MNIEEIYGILFNNKELLISESEIKAVEDCHEFLKEFVGKYKAR